MSYGTPLNFLVPFSIDWIERAKTIMADFLANVALKSGDITLVGMSQVEIKSRPSILDNIYNWKVFEDDDDILKFIQCIDRYETKEIDFNAFVEVIDGKDTDFGDEVV